MDVVVKEAQHPPLALETANWRMLPLYLVIEIVIGVGMFVAIGGAAVVLHVFVSWMKSHGLSLLIVRGATGLEYALYGVDVLLFAIYLARGTYHHIAVLSTAKVE